DGRADGRAGASDRARGGPDHRRIEARGAVDPARGAEPAARALRRRHGARALARPDRAQLGAGRPHGERRREIAVSWGMTRLRFGTFFFFQAAPGQRHEDIIRNELTQVEWSEELGFDEVWFTEHHFIDYGLSVDPAKLASAAAARTRRVRIGLAAALMAFHHQLLLTVQMVLDDRLSDVRRTRRQRR